MRSSKFKTETLKLKLEGWHQLMSVFGMAENDTTYYKLIEAYLEKHRAYHRIEHIEACFHHLDSVIEQFTYPHEVELALWFHDAIYKPFSATNEEDSAEWAKTFLSANSVSPDIIGRVFDLIILTKDHIAPHSMDAKFMLDIDLSILGAPEPIYAQFEKDVRTEYKRVPSFIFKKKRKEILESFVSRARLYHTDYFFEKFETQAKHNLSWAIESL